VESFIRDIDVPSKALEKMIGRFVRVLIIVHGSFSFLRDLHHAFHVAKNDIYHLNAICLSNLDL